MDDKLEKLARETHGIIEWKPTTREDLNNQWEPGDVPEASEQGEAQWQHYMENIYSILTGKHCDDKVALGMATSAADRMRQEITRLRAWKNEQLAVEAEWDARAVGRELELPLGTSIRAGILPAIQRLKSELATQRQEIERLNRHFMSAQETVSSLEVMQRRMETISNAHYDRAEKAEAERAAANLRAERAIEVSLRAGAERDIWKTTSDCQCTVLSGVQDILGCGSDVESGALAMKAERDGLKDKLKRYGAHDSTCARFVPTLKEPYACDCGFTDALAPPTADDKEK